MIYTPLTKKAMKIAFEAHKNQVDKSGMPYIFHPFHIAEQMTDEYSVCVALLHDVIEDSDITIDQLTAEGFPERVISALRLLTHNDALPYMDYIGKIKSDPISVAVKLADLRHNSDLSRLETVDETALSRAEKYSAAIDILSSAVRDNIQTTEV